MDNSNYISRKELIAFLDNLKYGESGTLKVYKAVDIDWLIKALSDTERFKGKE